MATDIGPKIGLDGEKEFRAALQSMGQQLKTLDTEMRAVTSAFSANDRSQAALSAQSDVLTKKLSTQEARLAEIQKALDYARANYAENSNEVQRWQQALNNATADVNKTKKEIEHLGDETQEAGGKVSIFGDVLKANLASEAIISGVKALSGAIKSLIGGAVENYGDFEQLVGGVETLFKDSAGIVQNYAKEAYKTAGLSANDYMETVTSFSASLLQSMGNDTQAAAEKANRAITDMSDNANKMGTDMSSIQNAYQGFAKQNYTMLDNLKLGYGGTKEEMARLIEDAAKIKGIYGAEAAMLANRGVNGDLAVIIDAIHTVQTEMGITGTTAKEAATTIQGSAAAAKAAWTNLTTGLGDENADLSQLLLTFGESVATAVKNIIPRIQQTLAGIGSALTIASQGMLQDAVGGIVDGLPQFVAAIGTLVSGMGQALINSAPVLLHSVLELIHQASDYVKANLSQFVGAGLTALVGFSDGFRGGVGQMVDAALELIKTLAAGIVEALPEFIATVPTIISNFANAINDNAPKIVKAGLDIIVTLVKGILTNIPVIIQNMPKIIAAIWDTLTAVNWVNLGAGLIKGVGDGIKSMTSFAKDSIETVKTAIHDGIKALPQTFMEIGRNMIQGMINGIKSMASSLVKNVGSAITSVVSSVRDMLGIHSPSRVFASIGEYMMDGLSIGLLNSSGKVMETIGDIVSEVKTRFSSLSDIFGTRQDIADLQYQLWGMTGGKNASEIDKYKRKMETLSKQEKDQAAIVEAAEAAYKAVVSQYGENSKESYEYQKTLLQEQIAYQKLIETMNQYREESRALRVGDSIASGIAASTKKAVSAAASLTTKLVDTVKSNLGIHSPSTVFAGIGENMALGLGKGFTAEMQGVSANIQDAIPTPAVDAVYNAAAGMVNGLAAANAGNGGGSYTINLLLQNGQQIASWLLPDLRDAARNNPEVARA